MKRAATCALVLLCLISARAQSRAPRDMPTAQAPDDADTWGKGVRAAFERRYPPDRTYAVVVRHDLPAISIKAREHGYPVEAGEDDWKGPGSMFRAKPAGNLAFGEVMKVERVDYADDHIEMRLVSADPHTIVADPDRPDRNRQEQVVTRLTVPHRAGIDLLTRRVDAYVRLFPGIDAARAYARSLRDPQPDRRFTLGVVRRDGILVPIAMYDDGHWFRRWPLPSGERDVPIGMRDIPSDWWGVEGASAKWTLWTTDGRSVPLQLVAPLAFGAHCLMNVGVRTDYRSSFPPTPLDQHHYPKDGIATTGSLPIEPLQVMTVKQAAWGSFETLIAPHVNRLEVGQLNRMPWSALSVRYATPVTLEVLAMASGRTPKSETVYFEATKRYEPPDKSVPNPCGLVTFAHGWVQRESSGVGRLDRGVSAVISDCSMWNVEFRKPLGVVRAGGNPVWIVEVSRWGGERYELVEMKESGASVLLSIPGGSCGRSGG